MRFEIRDIIKDKELDDFRALWIEILAHENFVVMPDVYCARYMVPSSMQLFIIDAFCGKDEDYKNSNEIILLTKGPAQAEFEALMRARGRALAAMFQRKEAIQ